MQKLSPRSAAAASGAPVPGNPPHRNRVFPTLAPSGLPGRRAQRIWTGFQGRVAAGYQSWKCANNDERHLIRCPSVKKIGEQPGFHRDGLAILGPDPTQVKRVLEHARRTKQVRNRAADLGMADDRRWHVGRPEYPPFGGYSDPAVAATIPQPDHLDPLRAQTP